MWVYFESFMSGYILCKLACKKIYPLDNLDLYACAGCCFCYVCYAFYNIACITKTIEVMYQVTIGTGSGSLPDFVTVLLTG